MAEKWISDTKILVSVKTLKYMVKGGRLSTVRGFIARILNINPIVTIDETGKATVFDKAFSQRANMEKVVGYIRKTWSHKKVWNYIILHACNPEAAVWFSEKMEAITGKKPVSVCNISPVIGANTGVGTAAITLQFE
jgi:DegV family protein with EDD domain